MALDEVRTRRLFVFLSVDDNFSVILICIRMVLLMIRDWLVRNALLDWFRFQTQNSQRKRNGEWIDCHERLSTILRQILSTANSMGSRRKIIIIISISRRIKMTFLIDRF
jgi:hypothetical protein